MVTGSFITHIKTEGVFENIAYDVEKIFDHRPVLTGKVKKELD